MSEITEKLFNSDEVKVRISLKDLTYIKDEMSALRSQNETLKKELNEKLRSEYLEVLVERVFVKGKDDNPTFLQFYAPLTETEFKKRIEEELQKRKFMEEWEMSELEEALEREVQTTHTFRTLFIAAMVVNIILIVILNS